MPQTASGLTYPDSSGSDRIWEHIQQLAADVEALQAGKLLGRRARNNGVADLTLAVSGTAVYETAGVTFTTTKARNIRVALLTSFFAGGTAATVWNAGIFYSSGGAINTGAMTEVREAAQIGPVNAAQSSSVMIEDVVLALAPGTYTFFARNLKTFGQATDRSYESVLNVYYA